MISGSLVAIVTPLTADGALDLPGWDRLLDFHLAEGTDGIVVAGTTGESPVLSLDEIEELTRRAVARCRGKLKVVVGAGTNSTAATVARSARLSRLGVDGVMFVTPYYNKPPQEGLFRHYEAIAKAVKLPIFIYNIPGRSVIDMSVETMARLAQIPNIAGVKDATANLTRPLHTLRACGADFIQLSGEDHTVLSYLAAGGHGCISVTANVAPRLCAEMHAAWARDDVRGAMAIQMRLLPLHDAMFCESNPGPVKYAASLLGFGTNHVRLPLAPVAEASAARVKAAMLEAGLLN